MSRRAGRATTPSSVSKKRCNLVNLPIWRVSHPSWPFCARHNRANRPRPPTPITEAAVLPNEVVAAAESATRREAPPHRASFALRMEREIAHRHLELHEHLGRPPRSDRAEPTVPMLGTGVLVLASRRRS